MPDVRRPEIDAEDDSLTERIFNEELLTGPHAGRFLSKKDFLKM